MPENAPVLLLYTLVKQEASVRICIKGSWRLWFGIWVLYFEIHKMLNIARAPDNFLHYRSKGINPLILNSMLIFKISVVFSSPIFFRNAEN